MLIIFAYSFRHDFQDVKNRITAQLFPHKASINEYGEVTFQASGDNHFYIEALVNGTIIRFLVDTGASRVVLTPKDAVRLGFQLDKLDFNQKSSTANGIVFGAPIVIDEIEVGDFSKRRIPASINGAEMRHSLLGMSFLGKLKSYRVEKGVLTLEP